jgi:hypothetical protein
MAAGQSLQKQRTVELRTAGQHAVEQYMYSRTKMVEQNAVEQKSRIKISRTNTGMINYNKTNNSRINYNKTNNSRINYSRTNKVHRTKRSRTKMGRQNASEQNRV